MTGLHFFIDVDQFIDGDLVSIEDGEFHHLCDVIRITEKEELILINGRGWVARGTVERIDRRRCLVRIQSSERQERPPPKLFLGVSFLRPSHLDFAVEKGVEVGVDQFVLFPADKSERKEISSSSGRRLEAVVTAAMKQSGRIFRPEVVVAASLQEALAILPSPHVIADVSEEAVPLAQCLEDLSNNNPISVLVGPESGWSEGERSLLANQGEVVLLHSNTLRAETAVIVAAYSVSRWLGY